MKKKFSPKQEFEPESKPKPKIDIFTKSFKISFKISGAEGLAERGEITSAIDLLNSAFNDCNERLAEIKKMEVKNKSISESIKVEKAVIKGFREEIFEQQKLYNKQLLSNENDCQSPH